MSDVEITEGSNAVEAKLAKAGADQVRRHSFSEAPETAPQGTPEETVSADQPRNDLGQFTATESSDTGTDTEAEPVSGEAQDQQATDPAVAALLQKYGGDVNKALNAGVHAQRLLGELGNELGQTRQENNEYQQMIEELRGLRGDLSAQQQNTPLDQATVDWFDQEAYNNPAGAAQYAIQQNNGMLFQRAMAVWKEQDPYGAAVYTNRLENQQLRQEMEQTRQQAAQLPMDSAMHMALSNVRAQHPEYSNYDDALGAVLEKSPFAAKMLEQAAASGDRQQLEGAIETLYSLAVGDTLRSLTLTGDAPDNATTSQEVVAPTTSETREPEPEPSQTDRFKDAFRQEAERQRRGVWVAE